MGGVGMAGMPYPPKCVLWAIHLCLVGAAETAAPPNIPCIPWDDTTHSNLLCIPCIPWEDTAHPNLPCVCSVGGHALLVYSSLVYFRN